MPREQAAAPFGQAQSAERTPGLAARTLCCPIKLTTQDLCQSQAMDIGPRSSHLVGLEAERAPGGKANETSHAAEPLPLNTHSKAGIGGHKT